MACVHPHWALHLEGIQRHNNHFLKTQVSWCLLNLSVTFVLCISMQTPKTWEISADLPGTDKQDIKVQVDGDVLTLSVEKSAAKEDKKEESGVKYHRSVDAAHTHAS